MSRGGNKSYRTKDEPRVPAAFPEADMEAVEDPKKDDRYRQSPLGIYIRMGGITYTAMLRALGINDRTLRAWIFEGYVPSLAQAYEVERITKGAVPMEAWLAAPKAVTTISRMREKQPDAVQRSRTIHTPGGFAEPASMGKRKQPRKPNKKEWSDEDSGD